jgi:hypothetical protein
MAYTITEPTNKNFLSPLGFRFFIQKTPNVNYFVQSVSIPDVNLGDTDLPTPFRRVPVAGDHIEYGDLTITFKVDESMNNYLELFNWITAIGFPDNFDQHKEVDPKFVATGSGRGVYSDATLVILSSAMNPLHEVVFTDVYPTALTDFAFDSRSQDVEYIEATATFKFKNMTFKPL